MPQQMIRSEAERQFYLGMAGIRMWYARDPLPGAAPSPEFDFGSPVPEAKPFAAATPAAGTRTQAQLPADEGKKDKLARLKTLMEAVPDKSRVQRAPNVEPVEFAIPEGAAEEAGEVSAGEDSGLSVVSGEFASQIPKLYLQAWSGLRVLLLTNLSEEASLSLQETLALNIMRSLGELSPGKLGALHWPLFNNLKISLNSEADLAGLTRDYLSGVAGKAVIVLGLAPEMSSYSSVLAEVIDKAPEVSFEHSLAALASDPELKKQLWQLIRPLVAPSR
ncbi:MAG: hypothetical protein HLUCCX14_14960 [Marinobacter excellens HL-55]|uniref:2-isopropylmalate synthase n=1 Tax=Marinobacter excellens HL-55 TaxID=1305731 RepID=A0A0N8KK90_9GAMM|nr:MAG: hypothetical protein HLUCCX14_14960 [Marinobacter excellens HL-55]